MTPDPFDFDLLIIGGGPAGLAAALHAARASHGQARSICVLEKGAEIGAHTLSGAVIDPRALATLLPEALGKLTPVRSESLLLRSARRQLSLPAWLLPPPMRHTAHAIGSLGEICKMLADAARALGVEIFTGYAAASLLRDDDGTVCGVVTGEFGRQRDGTPGPRFQPGMPLRARTTLLAEGACGSLTREAESLFGLRLAPQSYALGIKEIWRVRADQHRPGHVEHALGWPLAGQTSGGAFCYHYGENLVALGLVCGLEYRNPHFSPFDEAQRLKTHPALRELLAGGECLGAGARVLAQGGLQALPRLVFPGGALIGDTAGLLDASRTQGIHAALESGMLAAEAALEALDASTGTCSPDSLPQRLAASPLHAELQRARNVKPWLKHGWPGLLAAGAEQWLLRGHAPWTLRSRADYAATEPAVRHPQRPAPRREPGRVFTRDELLALAGVRHTEDQPAHLQVDRAVMEAEAVRTGGVEAQCCPAGVYAFARDGAAPRLTLTPANCLHCKCCEIKSPAQAVRWVPPQGGEGPFYSGM